MNFGRNDIDISTLDHHLPADTELTLATLSQPADVFEAYVGAPKWGYKHWVGKLYPPKTNDAEFLKHYTRHFNAVELGASFYQIPTPEQMMAWRGMAPQGFKFCPKFPQSITHIRRFRNVEAQTNQFYTSIAVLKENLGPVFMQLADNFTPNTFEDLKAYLMTLPGDVSTFVEVRNKKWFEHPNKLFGLLKDLNMGAVISDTAGRRDCLHMQLTIPHAFIRFVNCGDEPTDLLRLEEWVKRLKTWKQQGLQSLYFFIHAGDTPSLALFNYFIPRLNKELSLNIQIPEYGVI